MTKRDNTPLTNRRLACLNREQQRRFDGYNVMQKKYVLFRAQGYDKANAYKMTGYNSPNNNWSQCAYKMEKRIKCADIIEALKAPQRIAQLKEEGSEINKQIDEKANEIPPELLANYKTVPMESEVVDKSDIQAEQISVDQARNLQFYRDIVNGRIKSVKITKTYDKDGKLVGKKEESTITLTDRMNAQKEVMRITGQSEILELGSVQATPNINIMIVDASRKNEIPEEKPKEIELGEYEGEPALVEEVSEKEGENGKDKAPEEDSE